MSDDEPARSARPGAVPVLLTLMIVFLVAAGVFGVLWSEERNDYQTTVGQLQAAQTEARITADLRHVVVHRARPPDHGHPATSGDTFGHR
jgi:hypothetical protein